MTSDERDELFAHVQLMRDRLSILSHDIVHRDKAQWSLTLAVDDALDKLEALETALYDAEVED